MANFTNPNVLWVNVRGLLRPLSGIKHRKGSVQKGENAILCHGKIF